MPVLAGSSSDLFRPTPVLSASRCHAWRMRWRPSVINAQTACVSPELRELTYTYRTKTAPDGRPVPLGRALTRPNMVAAALNMLLAHEAIEVFGIFCLTTKRHVICWHEVSRGSLDAASVHPREVFKAAIVANAASIVIGHNHPSGDPEPSFADLELTARLVDAGRLLGVSVLDHVIIGHGVFVSLQAARLVVFRGDWFAEIGAGL